MSTTCRVNLGSDNVTGICPEIMDALSRANEGSAPAYGNDSLTLSLDGVFSELFDKAVRVYPVATGTIANALALAQLAPPWGAIYCHQLAHIELAECGAPEHATGGAKLSLLHGDHAKFSAEALELKLRCSRAHVAGRPNVTPAAASITQATERGTVYTVTEIEAIHAVCKSLGLRMHMDGARFANAVARLECSPAALTWRCGVDVLTFGATKNGAMCADAIVFFAPELAESFEYRRKRSGHTLSKMRFISAQLLAYVGNGLWLRNARHANRMAELLVREVSSLRGVSLAHPQHVNEVFLRVSPKSAQALKERGFGFSQPAPDDPGLIRAVTAFDTQPEQVAEFARALASTLTV